MEELYPLPRLLTLLVEIQPFYGLLTLPCLIVVHTAWTEARQEAHVSPGFLADYLLDHQADDATLGFPVMVRARISLRSYLAKPP